VVAEAVVAADHQHAVLDEVIQGAADAIGRLAGERGGGVQADVRPSDRLSSRTLAPPRRAGRDSSARSRLDGPVR